MNTQTLLIIGSGGREHALAWALARSPKVEKVYVAPGNAGTEWAANPQASKLRPRAASVNAPIAVDDIPALIAFARQKQVDLTIVGPEVPLAAGIVDSFQTAGLSIFGPSCQAARLEASKVFAKKFMRRHNIPTGDFEIFDDFEAASEYLRQIKDPVVVKADGLAAGKGVIVCDNAKQAQVAIQRIMVDRAFGTAGQTVLIEKRLSGPEISILAWSDGKTVIPIIPARDHKRAYDGDKGPNTGGMGVYAPAPDISPALIEDIKKTVLEPTIVGLAKQGIPYVGILYAGIMLTEAGPKVLEFNCRFGDPETQAVLPLLKTDLLDIFWACIKGDLDTIDIQWHPGASASVILASPGYPDSYPKGAVISGLDAVEQLEDVVIFHAGTAKANNQIVTSGGRVLAVNAVSQDLATALKHAYAAVAQIHFEGVHYRRDIGQQMLEKTY